MKTPAVKVLLLASLLLIIAITSFVGTGRGERDEFSIDKFRDPEPFYRPGYFWSWNDTMTRDLMERQLRDMASRGAMTVCPLPIPSGFRPVNMPTTMTPDYMTPEYLEMFRFVAEKCRELGMVSYFYDEGGWPSGSCLGQVVAKNPSLARQALSRQVITPKAGSSVEIPGGSLAAFLYRGDKRIRRLSPGTTITAEADSSRILIFTVTKGGQYPDLLNPESTEEFIRLTHEKYRQYLDKYFGSTLRIAFTDEPKIANPGWTGDLASGFMETYGYDIVNELPSIFDGDSEHDRKVRIDYFDWWSQRFADAYFGKIREWCKKNNLLSGGHLDGEDATLYARTYGYGHPLRALRKMDVPAVDVIWRQLWPGAVNHHFPKFASTTAHQAGQPWAFTESFAVYGNGLTASQMKWISDYQYVRGINLLVLGGYPLSKDDWLLAGCRPNFGPGDPVWEYMRTYHDYIARLSYIMSLGKPDIKVALYYPVRDIWAGGEELRNVCNSHDEMARTLLEHQVDFDLVDDDVLGGEMSRAANGKLIVGPMSYEAVCVPRNRYMTARSREKLQQFINSGGKVFWPDDDTGAAKPAGVDLTDAREIASKADPTARLLIPDNGIRVCKRELQGSSIYFITNEDTCRKSIILEFSEDMPPVRLDPETGSCRIPSQAERRPEGWQIPVELDFAGSALFIFTNALLPAVKETSAPGRVMQVISDGWKLRKSKEAIITSKSLITKDHQHSSGSPVTMGDWKDVAGISYSGDCIYEVVFRCSGKVASAAKLIDLGDVRYFCSAELNGKTLGSRIWKPFAFEVNGLLREGDNILRITVTNTLANQYVTTKALEAWSKNQVGPYHQRALAFEKESLPSGLYGPVTIR